jgi:hypothetical protein
MTLDTYGSLYKGDLHEDAQRMGAGFVYRVRTGSA